MHITIGRKPDHVRKIRYRSFGLNFLIFAANYKDAMESAEEYFNEIRKDDDVYLKSNTGTEIKYDALFQSKKLKNE